MVIYRQLNCGIEFDSTAVVPASKYIIKINDNSMQFNHIKFLTHAHTDLLSESGIMTT